MKFLSQTSGEGGSIDIILLSLIAQQSTTRGFHVGDALLGGVRIFDTRVKIQHDTQWRASNYRS